MLVVKQATGLATVQDLGRAGLAAQGVPRGGALVGALARRANAAAGNADDAACIEVFGRLALVAEERVVVATEAGAPRELGAGEAFVVDGDPRLRARYVAIAGGVAAPVVLGSRSTLAVCGIGRALRAGDRIERAGSPRTPRDAPPFDRAGAIGVLAGPDDPELAERLAASPWRITAASDRTGTRLEGATLARAGDLRASSPMVPGAIQLPSGGAPIVIGPDGPTTGGYPIVAVVLRADLDRFHALPMGASVAFEVRAHPR